MSKIKARSFIYGAVILSIAGVVAKGLGAVYKIPLTNILGAYGIGLYYLIFPIYSILLVISSSGISIACAKYVASYNKCGDSDMVSHTLRVSIIFSTVVSVIVSLILGLCASFISRLQGTTNATLGIIGITPAIVFASIVAIFRGYFQGLENMVPTSISNILEQVIKIGIGLLLSYKLLPYGISYAVLGATIGVTACEFVTMLVLIFRYIYYLKTKITPKCMYCESLDFKNFYRYSIYSTISCIFLPLCSLLDSFVVINVLNFIGMDTATATSLYGISCGVVATLTSIPVIFTVAITTVLVPNISGVVDENYIAKRCSMMLKIGWLISLLFFVGIIVLGDVIIEKLYGGGLTSSMEYDFAVRLLLVSSVGVIYQAFMQLFSGILQAIDHPEGNVYAYSIAFVFRVAILISCMTFREINIFGQVIANLSFMILASVIQLIYIRKYVTLTVKFDTFMLRPTIVTIISGLLMWGVKVATSSFNSYIEIISCVLVGIISYLILVVVFRIFDANEQRYFPKFLRSRVSKKNSG